MKDLEQPMGVSAFAHGRLLGAVSDSGSLALTEDGHLVVTVRGEMMARTDGLLLCSDNVRMRPLNWRMQGRQVEEVFHRLAAIEGEGYFVLGREDEQFFVVNLERDLCFFVESRLWALEPTLMWDVGTLPGSRGESELQLVRVAGEGRIAIRVPGDLVTIKVTPDRPHRVRTDAFVGWIGHVVPVMDDYKDYLRCEGEGAVFVSLPRAGERRGAALDAGTQ
jgi:hypothetical protein